MFHFHCAFLLPVLYWKVPLSFFKTPLHSKFQKTAQVKEVRDMDENYAFLKSCRSPFDNAVCLLEDAGLREMTGSFSWKPSGLTFLLVRTGTLEVRLEDRVLSGPFLLFFSKEPVLFTCREKTEVFFFILKPETLIDACGSALLLQVSSYGQSEAWCAEMERLTQNVYQALSARRISTDDPQDAAGISEALYPVWTLLTASAGNEKPPETPSGTDGNEKPPETPSGADGNTGLLSDILGYMERFYNAGITQAGTAEYFHISPQYLSRLLTASSGMTFRAYRNAVRERIMGVYREYTSLSEEEIEKRTAPDALSLSGTGTSAPESLPGKTLLFPASECFPYTSGATGRSYKRISAALHFTENFSGNWKRLINLGYAPDLLNLQLDSTLSDIQSKVGFRFGRICRILDPVLLLNADGRKILDFSNIFQLLDTCIFNKMTPFLEIGNKTFMIQETNSIFFEPGSATDPVAYYTKLFELLPDFLATCINHYGQEEVDTWRFEVSYMFTGTEKEHFSFIQYIKVFRRIQKIIRAYSEKCRIGAPGYNSWDTPGQIHSTLALLDSYHAVPDFLTVYAYPIEDFDKNSFGIAKDPDLGLHRLESFAKEARLMFPDTEIWVTEFNSNLSSRNSLNDSEYQAAYLAKTLLSADALRISAMGYYLLSDAPLRYSDSLSFLFGGWGLYSDSGLPKASCQCYAAFAKLGRYKIKAEENYLITADSVGSFQMLFIHYRHMQEDYRIRNAAPEELQFPDSVFLPAPPDEYHVRISGLAPGTYAVREYRIDSENANLFREWQKAGYLPAMQSGMIRDFRLLSSLSPRILVRRILPGEDSMVFTVSMDGIQVRFFSAELYAAGTDPAADSQAAEP